MKIAVTYDEGKVFQHFGHSKSFKIYDIADKNVLSTSIFAPEGDGHCALGTILKQQGVDTLICGGIGAGAVNVLEKNNIAIFSGVNGDADEAVSKLLNGTLSSNKSSTCNCKH